MVSRYIKKIVAMSIFIMSSLYVNAGVIISEIMPCNVSTKLNDRNNYTGWVEFYNDGDSKFNLNGSTITQTSKKGKVKWEWTIQHDLNISANSYVIIFFDKIPSDPTMPQKKGHSCYKVDPDGGSLMLMMPDGNCSILDYPKMYPHLSYGVKEGTYGYMNPSAIAKNNTPYPDVTNSRCAAPVFGGMNPGVYNSASGTITLSCSNSDSIIYTKDGSFPSPKNENACVYKKPIEFDKTRVLRARAYSKGKLPSEIVTASYILYGDERNSCSGLTPAPVVSIVANDEYFYSDTMGIYVVGSRGIEGEKSCVKERANFNQDWDRPVNLEYFVDGSRKMSQEADVAVMGGCSRQVDYTVKSLKMSTGKKQGAELFSINPFKDKEKKGNVYNSFQLRNGGNAYPEGKIRVRDGFMQNIARSMGNIDYQAYQPVGYYLNGKYKGLMGLRERTNKSYVFSNYGYDEDEIDVIEITQDGIEATTGDLTAYNQMVDFAKKNYDKDYFVARMNDYLDLDEYLNYIIFEQFIVNTDWPGNNYKMWRHRANGKFRCILFDTDFGFGLYEDWGPNYCNKNLNMIKWCMGTGSEVNWGNGNPSTNQIDDAYRWKTILFYSLMQNEKFKQMYLTKSLIHLANALSYDNVKNKWESIVSMAQGEYCAKYNGRDLAEETGMLDFAKQRVDVVYEQLADFYDLSTTKVKLSLSCENSDASFMLNGVNLGKNSFSLNCLKNMTVDLGVTLPDGYKVKKWVVGDTTYTTSTIQLTMKSATEVVLKIEEDSYDKPAIFINEVCSKNTILKDPGTDSKPDWIELYNAGNVDVDIAGYYISDDPANPLKHQIASGYTSSIIPAKGYVLLWADDKSNYGPMHLGFKLSDTEGETIVLSKVVRDSIIKIDKIAVPSVGENNSYGREKDGQSTFTTFAVCSDGYSMEATPAASNGHLDCDSLVLANNLQITLYDQCYKYTRFLVNGVKTRVNPATCQVRKDADLIIEPLIDDQNFVSWTISKAVPYSYEWMNSSTSWRYFYDSIAAPKDWNTVGFDDSGWKKGKGRFGYDTSNKRTYDVKLNFGDSTSNKYLTSYFRTTFTYDKSSMLDSAKVTVVFDDGAVVYLNGKELMRENMPSGTVSYSTETPSYLDDVVSTFVLKASDFVEGENVLAVEVHQYNGQSSDMTFLVNAVGYGSTNKLTDKILKLHPEENLKLTLTSQGLVELTGATTWSDPIYVSPNPAEEYVMINSRMGEILVVSLMDQAGRELKKIYPLMDNCELNVSNIQQGCYILRIDTKTQSYIQKLMIK
ncbi:MAG: CotH kinase family protein [Paludibacteraceae bacterium]|nr:CotH kinase family protein [Paludibacteraceae bacterium]